MSTIVFIGFRASGKSLLGSWLAEELRMPFVDTDDVVLAHLGFDSVDNAWEQVGEEGWREAELLVIPPLFEQQSVIALGGGAPMIQAIQKAMGSVDTVFNLTANEKMTVLRMEAGEDRPALSNPDLDVRLERLPTYAMLGTCGIETSGDIDDIKAKILDHLNHGHTNHTDGNHPIF